jgi:hypothetical protein
LSYFALEQAIEIGEDAASLPIYQVVTIMIVREGGFAGIGCAGGAVAGSEGGPPGESIGCGAGALGAVGNMEITPGIILTAAVVATWEGYNANKEAERARKNYKAVCQ